MMKMCEIVGVAPLNFQTSLRFFDCVHTFLWNSCVQLIKPIKPGGQQGYSECFLPELCDARVIYLSDFLGPLFLSLSILTGTLLVWWFEQNITVA